MRLCSTVARWSCQVPKLAQLLTVRQLTRQHHLLAAALTRWDPGSVCARQPWGCSGGRPRLPCRRFKSNSEKGAAGTTADEEEEEEEEEEAHGEDEEQPDASVPDGYKDVEKSVQSFRYDMIMKAGLDVARNKIEDALYHSRLRLNGQRLLKKSKKVRVGDTLDLIVSEDKEAGTVQLKRVVLRKVLWESPEEERFKVSLRRWKILELRSQEASKLDSGPVQGHGTREVPAGAGG
ncbi:mitochondrial transcription rescue factor 1 [Synchiropus splendidus]|uniref:mitochondrial transcription rescue factor 1 n=1 Tax=Synchiropus splendidus TaxID=270530 RepID=UPI00237E86C4|nr:mitochondrial transcription rescue factor 1 [Synchiropus splendidus]